MKKSYTCLLSVLCKACPGVEWQCVMQSPGSIGLASAWCAQNVLISCSLDSSIKVWQPIDPPTPGAFMDISPVYVQPPDEAGKPVSPLHPPADLPVCRYHLRFISCSPSCRHQFCRAIPTSPPYCTLAEDLSRWLSCTVGVCM